MSCAAAAAPLEDGATAIPEDGAAAAPAASRLEAREPPEDGAAAPAASRLEAARDPLVPRVDIPLADGSRRDKQTAA